MMLPLNNFLSAEACSKPRVVELLGHCFVRTVRTEIPRGTKALGQDGTFLAVPVPQLLDQMLPIFPLHTEVLRI